MKRFFSIITAFAIVALCVSPLFFPDSGLLAQNPEVDATELEATDKGVDYTSLPDGGAATDAAAEAQAPQGAQIAQAPDPVEVPWYLLLLAWMKANTAEAILAFLGITKIIVNLTPTDRDNKWYDMVERFFNSIIPNLKKGGGTFASKA